MPFSTYSEYTDPETGEKTWVPDLSAGNTGGIRQDEMESWIENGDIPKEIIEANSKFQTQWDEITKELEKGKNIPISKMPPFPNPTLTDFIISNQAHLRKAHYLNFMFSLLDSSDPDIVWLHLIKKSINGMVAQNPLQIHHYIAQNILKERYGIEDKKMGDLLAREILESCEGISKFEGFKHPILDKRPLTPNDLKTCFPNSRNDMLLIDDEFVNFIKETGKKGKELATKIKENGERCFSQYNDSGNSQENRPDLWSLWVPVKNAEKEFERLVPPFLIALSSAIWEDRCAHKVNRSPSVAKPILDRIIPVTAPKKSPKNFKEKDGNIIYHDPKGEPLFLAPAIDANMIDAFKKGIKGLGTLTGHKLLRWQVNTGFHNWNDGVKDPRLIEIDGGYSKIAELVGTHSTKEIAKIKDILHAQAHGYFVFPDGSRGNMIILNILERYRNTEPSKIKIVLGDLLLPGYVCQLKRSERRLIPIGDLPPLYGSRNTHAAQAQLQLLVFSEFSNQSQKLAESGYVVIEKEKWRQLAFEAGLNPERIEDVITHWSQPDLVHSFLEKSGDEYRLASYYERESRFLVDQGKVRNLNSEHGKKSTQKKARKRSKKA